MMAAWFASGVVMHFVPYPALSSAERLARSQPIDLASVEIAPLVALEDTPQGESLRLVGLSGRPVYLVAQGGHPVTAIFADTGAPLGVVSGQEAARIASVFQRSPAVNVAGPLINDQWTVAQEFDPFRPFYRVDFGDALGTELYVSARSGEILQQTTARERLWNWFGANIHWIYFRALRAHWNVWDRLVWSLSLVALATTIAGLWLGLVRLAAARRSGRHKLTPFRGWLGWHHRLGLFAGLFVLTWIASGWLSMDHGRIFPTGVPSSETVSRMRGLSMQAIAEAIPVTALQSLGRASEVLLIAVGGHPCLVVRGPRPPARVVATGSIPDWMGAAVPDPWVQTGLHAVWPNRRLSELRPSTSDDFYAMAEGIPAGTRRIRLEGPGEIAVYVEPDSGQILCVLDAGRRTYEWVYYALHTFKFPGLGQRPMLRRALILLPLTLGFAFSVSGVFVAATRLRGFVGRRT